MCLKMILMSCSSPSLLVRFQNMGVPRLFRMLVERYPLLLRDVNPSNQPVFDNLYLDFNGLPCGCCIGLCSHSTGIVHSCTHNNDDSLIRTEDVGDSPNSSAPYVIFQSGDDDGHLFVTGKPGFDGCAHSRLLNVIRRIYKNCKCRCCSLLSMELLLVRK